MRTEEEVKKELAELSDKFDLLKGDTNEMWRFWEEDKTAGRTRSNPERKSGRRKQYTRSNRSTKKGMESKAD